MYKEIQDNSSCIIYIMKCLFLGMTCREDIEENHLGTGNEKIRTCPTDYDSLCEVPLKNEQGSVTFVCKHGFWIVAQGNYIRYWQ